MALPSFSFGAEGVEYGRSSAYYATTTGDVVLPNDLDVKGNLLVEGTSILTGSVRSDGNISARNALVTGSTGLSGGAIYGFNGTTLVQPNFPLGLITQGPVQLGATGSATQSGLQVFGNAVVAPSAGGGGTLSATTYQGGAGGVSTSGALITGTAGATGGAIYGYNGGALVAPNFPLGLLAQGPMSQTLSTLVIPGAGGNYNYTWNGTNTLWSWFTNSAVANVYITIPDNFLSAHFGETIGTCAFTDNTAPGAAVQFIIQTVSGAILSTKALTSAAAPSGTITWIIATAPGAGSGITTIFNPAQINFS